MGRKLTIQEVRKIIEEKGGKLLSKKYTNNKTKLKIKCSEGHVFWMRWNDIQQKHWCLKCGIKRNADNQRLTIQKVRKVIEKKGGKLLSKEYKNAHAKLKIKCSKGHVFWTNWHGIQQGHWCSDCGGTKRLTIQEVKKVIKEKGGILLSKEYIGSGAKLKIKCSEGHVFWMTWGHIRKGQWCRKCSKIIIVSKPQKFIFENIQQYFPNAKCNEPTGVYYCKTRSYEGDIVIFGKDKCVIEYDGERWHRTKRSYNCDVRKTKRLIEAGFKVIRIRHVNHKEIKLDGVKTIIYKNASKKSLKEICKQIKKLIN